MLDEDNMQFFYVKQIYILLSFFLSFSFVYTQEFFTAVTKQNYRGNRKRKMEKKE